MNIKELVKEGWIVSDNEGELTQDEIDELVFQTWGWALKTNNFKLKNNEYLKKRVSETNFKEVFKKRQKRLNCINNLEE